MNELSINGLDTSTVSRRYDDAKLSVTHNTKLAYARELVVRRYTEKIAESQD